MKFIGFSVINSKSGRVFYKCAFTKKLTSDVKKIEQYGDFVVEMWLESTYWDKSQLINLVNKNVDVFSECDVFGRWVPVKMVEIK